ncbi:MULTISPECIES: MinD/ParA family protein [unclassified Nocardioides]|uniref:MinD/ParA family ATP-binding protein n=1 Tax=unclassified Nocardioides TaxID=2615069 RepID=UPI000A4D2937|nr:MULTISPECIES: hypothetical protein [unclassified Nocardioides]
MPDDAPVSGNGPDQHPRWQLQPSPVAGPSGPYAAHPPTATGHQNSQQNGPSTNPGARRRQPGPTDGAAAYNGAPPSYAQPPQHQRPPAGAHQAQPPTGQQPPPAGQQGPPQGGQYAGQQPNLPPQQEPEPVPTAQDFLRARHQAIDIGPATWGWRGVVRKLTFGLIKPKMGKAERTWRQSRAAVQRSFAGPRTVVFANPKGGAAKTTSVLAAGYTFGTVRGGGVVAWDNNETRGTLGMRGEQVGHHNTTRELLDDLERFQDVYESRIGDLSAFVRSQGDAHFDVLASDERADVTGTIKANDFDAVHRLLERFYHLILVDTGNNLRAENWLAAAKMADLIVVTCTVREDTGYSGLWMLDALADAGHSQIKDKTITVLADPSPNVDAQLAKDLTAVYAQRTRDVFRIPYDPALVAGSVVQYDQLSDATRSAWLKACAAMAEAL